MAKAKINLKEGIKYANKSIVSKMVIDAKSGTVTLFAFDKGQGLSEHTAPFDALVQVVDGEAQIKIAGEPVKVKEGEIILMPAGIPHALYAAKKFKMLLTMIRNKQ